MLERAPIIDGFLPSKGRGFGARADAGVSVDPFGEYFEPYFCAMPIRLARQWSHTGSMQQADKMLIF